MATSLPPESLYPPFCPWPYGSALSQEASEEKKANHQQERWRSLIAGCCSVVSWSLADIHSMCLWRVWATHLFSFPHVIIKHPFSVFISMALQVKWNTIGPYFKLFTPGLDLSLCCHCRRGSCVDAEWSMRTFVANGGATCIGELNHRCSVLLIDLFFFLLFFLVIGLSGFFSVWKILGIHLADLTYEPISTVVSDLWALQYISACVIQETRCWEAEDLGGDLLSWCQR